MNQIKFQTGATLVEYALLVAMIAVITIASVTVFGRRVACTLGIASYGIARPDRSYDELRQHLPSEYVIGADYFVCSNL